MKRITSLALCLAVGSAVAHGPTPRRLTESIDIAAPPAKVWKLAGDFGGIAKWHPLVEKATVDKGNKSDSQRDMTLKNGAHLIESMDFYDAPKMSYTYRLMNEDVQKFAVSFYSATLTVTGTGKTSHVEWVGNFYRADTQNEPAENMNDEAAEKTMKEFLDSGLQGLKQAAEH